MTTYIINIISLLGGLALFLFGMDIMGKSLERQAGGKLQTILAKMSSTVFKGFLLGLAVTAVIQSSSATTVMVVGFVNSGIMTLKQAVGVIMGSNIGTTVTAWILSLSGLEGDSFLIQLFKPSTLAPLLGTVGIVLYMFLGSEKHKNIGSILLGFLALMTGMDIMGDSMAFLENEPWFAQLMISFSNPFIGILFGAVLTPSSSVPPPLSVFCRGFAAPASSPSAPLSPSSWVRTSVPVSPPFWAPWVQTATPAVPRQSICCSIWWAWPSSSSSSMAWACSLIGRSWRIPALHGTSP